MCDKSWLATLRRTCTQLEHVLNILDFLAPFPQVDVFFLKEVDVVAYVSLKL